MSFLPQNPDGSFFTQLHSQEGLAYKKLWRDLLWVQRRLSMMHAYPHGYRLKDVIAARHEYIYLSNQCSKALQQLEQKHPGSLN